jgi:ATP-binding cassette subfamily F protein 3
MHLLSLIADRLWLVKDGLVTNFLGDLDAYRKLLLEAPTKKIQKEKKVLNVEKLNGLQADVRRCEQRLEKLTEMQNTLSKRLGDPKAYEEKMSASLVAWQKKYSEVMEAIEVAEKLWLKAQEKLDKHKI